ncbi:MAG: DUF427 domain-containing protein [Actinomycetota bacterium]
MPPPLRPFDLLEPSDGRAYSEPFPRRVRATLGDTTIVDTKAAHLVWEHRYYPQYYVPMEDVLTGVLRPSTEVGHHDGLGLMRYWHVQGGGGVERPNGAWMHPEAEPEFLRPLVRFAWASADAWHEEEREVFVHPRNPYVRVDVLPSTREVRVEVEGELLARSSRPVLVFETGLPVRYYLPCADVRVERLEPSPLVTGCPYKGEAVHWRLASADPGKHHAGDPEADAVAWTYEDSLPELAGIRNLISFYPGQVELYVDGHRQPPD